MVLDIYRDSGQNNERGRERTGDGVSGSDKRSNLENARSGEPVPESRLWSRISLRGDGCAKDEDEESAWLR